MSSLDKNNYVIHTPSAVSPTVQIGGGTIVWHFAIVEDNVLIGAECVIGSNVFVGRNSILGDGVRIQHGAFIARGSRIGNRVFIGPNATLTDDKYPRAGQKEWYRPEPPVIEDGASIGAGAVILPGVRIGRRAMIGAGAVVTDHVPDEKTYIGVPARELTF